MASILQIDGKWRALVRRKGFKQRCKTFAKRAQAEAWARQIEADMDAGRVTPEVNPGTTTVGHVIQTYRGMRNQSHRPISELADEHYVIERLARWLGDRLLPVLSTDDLLGYARGRVAEGVSPSTINGEISKLGTVLRYGCSALRLPAPDVVKQARPLLTHLGLIGAANKRARRPEEDELQRVLNQLAQRGQIYVDAVEFCAWSAMRRGEVCRVLKADVDVERRMLMIRDRKHPRQKLGNNEEIPLLGRAWQIAETMLAKHPDDDRLFPVHPQTLSKYFRWACRDEGIPDLRLHDLRHEGTSRLFEDGYGIEQVALVTGHRDWSNLRRYANLRPEDLHKGPRVRGKG